MRRTSPFVGFLCGATVAALVCLMVFGTKSGLHAQSIDKVETRLGDVALELGMSEAEVRRALEPKYDVIPSSGVENVFTILGRDPRTMIGSLQLHNGQLALITEEWTVHASEEAIGVALFRAMRKLSRHEDVGWSRSPPCYVVTREGPSPDDGLITALECEDKRVLLTVARAPESAGSMFIQFQVGHVDK